MTTPKREKKPYSPPRLRRYGDLRTLTAGGGKNKDEGNTHAGPKTRPGGG